MTIKVRVGGALKTVSSIRLRVSGALRSVVSVRVMSGDLKTVYAVSNPVASITPNPAHKSSITSPVTYKPVCIVTGGALPISYSWTLLASDNGTPSISGGETSSPTLSAALSSGETATCTYRCSITDALGSAASADVQITFERVFTE